MSQSKFPKILGIWLGFLQSFCFAVNSDSNEELIRARRDLILAKKTLARIEIELQQLRADAEPAGDVLIDYEIYRDRVEKMVSLHHGRVQFYEGLISEARSENHSITVSNTKLTLQYTPVRDESPEEELARSLSAFDEFVLQELEILEQQKKQVSTEETLNGLAAEAAAAVQRLENMGIKLEPEMDHSGMEGEERNGLDVSGSMEVGKINDLEVENTHLVGDRPILPSNEGFIGDDDIVARQLKEAAEKEKDPLLKEKLLKEYHAYKHTVQGRWSP